MRIVQVVLVVSVLAAATACSEPLRPSSAASDTTSRYTGTYLGSGLSATGPGYTPTGSDSVVSSRGSGYIGSGH
jgi:hypothetical protein